MRPASRRAAAVSTALIALTYGVTARGQTSASASDSDLAAEQLLAAGQTQAARALIEETLRAHPDDNQALFLKGLEAMNRRDGAAAVAAFRKLLARVPSNARVRLELARAYLMKGDAANAEREFRLAKAGGLPPNVSANVESYLATIRRRRSWSSTLTLTAGADSNLNRGTSAQAVEIFGLPFQLSDDARRKSGFGLNLEATADWRPLVFGRQPSRLSAQLERLQASDARFDDMTLTLEAGPRLRAGPLDVTPMIETYARWIADRTAAAGGGVRIEADIAPGTTTQMTAAASVLNVRYPSQPDEDGPLATVEFYALRAVNSGSLVRGSLALSRQMTRVRALDNTALDMRLGYWRALPWGIALYAEPSLGRSNYDSALVAFGRRRRDLRVGARVEIVGQRPLIADFRPIVRYDYLRQDSTVALYAYSRSEVAVGLSRSF